MRPLFACSVPRAWLALAIVAIVAGGCGPKSPKTDPEPTLEMELGATVGSVAQVVEPTEVAVEGYGLVGNLPGTGSVTCPPQVRAYLRQYILTQLPERTISVDGLINSNTTAVVRLEGVMAPLSSTGDHFDVRVTLIPGSETTSLQGGWLYRAELHPQGSGGMTGRVLAAVEGPTFVDALQADQSDETTAYILGGGRTLDDYAAVIAIPEADYALANAIRNRLSERYGPSVVERVAPDGVQYVVPSSYLNRKGDFVAMVRATFLQESPELLQRRLDHYIGQLVAGESPDESEIALEAIGRRSLESLAPLLTSTNAELCFRTARIMLNLGDDRALPVLREAAMNPESAFRFEAIETMADSARRNDAIALLRILVRDNDVRVVLAAYERLRDMADISISRDFVGRSFYLERVPRAEHKMIFASRRGDPRIVLFGGPLTCRDEVLIQSDRGDVIISARPGQGYVSLARQDQARGSLVGLLRTSYVVTDIIRALGTEANQTGAGQVSGLEVSYSELLALLEKLCASGAVDAEFWPGPLPEFE